jgi:putative transposase
MPVMETFRQMVNDCIRIGLESNTSSMKNLSMLSYQQFSNHDIISYYKLCAISRAAGILANRKKSLKRGFPTKDPFMTRPMLISCYGFKIVDGCLRVPLGNKKFLVIPLLEHTKRVLSQPNIRVRSFTLTPSSLSICYSKEMEQIECTTTIGIDRNLANVTVGNSSVLTIFDVSPAVRVAENSRSVTRAFKRNDSRVKKHLAQKHGRRRKTRVNQLLHKVSKAIVQRAKEKKAAIVFEDIKNIRRLYQRGNNQLRDYRFKMNSWSFYELKRQIEYKAQWEGIPVIIPTKGETRGTSQLCPRCGKRTQVARRDDVQHKRQLWCETCERWQDRDVVAVMNIARKGWLRFDHPQGVAGEAMVQESGSVTPVILKVDAAKLGFRYQPKT